MTANNRLYTLSPMSNENEKLQQLQQQVQTLCASLTEQIFLRDVLLLVNTANNPYDRAIIEKLMKGTKLEEGDWTHIFGEAGKLKDLPESHTKALQRIFQRLSRKEVKS